MTFATTAASCSQRTSEISFFGDGQIPIAAAECVTLAQLSLILTPHSGSACRRPPYKYQAGFDFFHPKRASRMIKSVEQILNHRHRLAKLLVSRPITKNNKINKNDAGDRKLISNLYLTTFQLILHWFGQIFSRIMAFSASFR